MAYDIVWNCVVWILQKPRTDVPGSTGPSLTDTITKRMQGFPYTPGLYDEPETGPGVGSIAAKLGLKMPNLAPDLDTSEPMLQPSLPVMDMRAAARESVEQNPSEPKKKKYAKEAWPGKKPTHSLFGWGFHFYTTCIHYFVKLLNFAAVLSAALPSGGACCAIVWCFRMIVGNGETVLMKCNCLDQLFWFRFSDGLCGCCSFVTFSSPWSVLELDLSSSFW